MTTLSPEQVRHIAKLARLNLKDEEVEKFATELTAILAYVEKLQEVDTEGIEALSSVTGCANVLRKDVVCTDGPDSAALLACSPLPIVEQQIETQSAHG